MIGGLGFFPAGVMPFWFPCHMMAQKEGAKMVMTALAVGAFLSGREPQSEKPTVHAYVDGKPVKSYVVRK